MYTLQWFQVLLSNTNNSAHIGQRGLWSNRNEGLFHISQSSTIGALKWWFTVICRELVSGRGSLTPLQRYSRRFLQPQSTWLLYPTHSLGESYPSAEISPAYSITPADYAVISSTLVGGVLPLCGDVTSIFYNPSQLGCYI